MLSRRALIFASLAGAIVPGAVMGAPRVTDTLSWPEYQRQMEQLAFAYANGSVTQKDMAGQGAQLLRALDTSGKAFQAAIDASWESGNRYWLWQRLTRLSGINGGILTIEREQDVPLHDHPGATGMVRILSGELEVWQFDRPRVSAPTEQETQAVLERVSHRILRPGDIAILSPDKGNIHALRSKSETCSMLDYFIPPFERSVRTWYQPLDKGWHDKTRIVCSCIGEDEFYMS